MDEQIDVIVLRCKECWRLRPDQTPTAVGRLVRGPGGPWEADSFEHSPAIVQPFRLGVSAFADGHALVGDDGRLWSLSLVPVRLSRDTRTDLLSCRGGCGRPAFRVRRAKVGGRALARGRTEIDV